MGKNMYCCNNCAWYGQEAELDHEIIESCMGPSPIETCPRCGSFDVDMQNNCSDQIISKPDQGTQSFKKL